MVMPIARRCAAFSLTAVLGVAALIPAALAQAQGNCEWYANLALQQQKVNLDRGCGFAGPAWSSNRSAHMSWCATVAPEVWKNQAKQRDQQLAKCTSK
jgi:hypothetical protein